jgi:hypothetical protein
MIKKVFRKIDMIKITRPQFRNEIMTVKTKVNVPPLVFLYTLTVRIVAIYDMLVSVYHCSLHNVIAISKGFRRA